MPDKVEPIRKDLPYPMPWCIESQRSKPQSRRRTPHDGSDDETTELERWVDEFTDERTGGVSLPPMN